MFRDFLLHQKNMRNISKKCDNLFDYLNLRPVFFSPLLFTNKLMCFFSDRTWPRSIITLGVKALLRHGILGVNVSDAGLRAEAKG